MSRRDTGIRHRESGHPGRHQSRIPSWILAFAETSGARHAS
jgi:hypothetical protein